MELMDYDRLNRQLRLLNDFQAELQAGCWELQAGADHIFWSDAMFALHELEINPENLIAVEEAERFIYEPDRKLVQEKREELDRSGYVEYYLRIITATQQTKRIYAREKKLLLNGQVIYQGIWQDEAGQRELHRPLTEQHQQLARQLKIFERAEQVGDTGSWQVNLETYETFYSDNIYRIHGLVPQSISPHVDSFRKYIHLEDKAVVIKAQEKAYVEMIPLHLEYRIVRESGEVRYISQVSHLTKNEKGEHILSGSIKDVTEQKLLELRLTEANDILSLQNELFMEAEKIGKLGTWQLYLETRKVVYSANLYRIYGLKPHAVPPGIENFIHFVHPDDREMLRDANAKAHSEHIPPNLTYRITRNDGKPRVVTQRSRLIKDGEGELMLIGIVQDITEQQLQEKQLRETNDKLEIQNEAFHHAEKIASIGSWTWNIDTEEIHYSDNVYAIYGLKPQSIPPGFANFGKYMHPDDRERMKDMAETIRNAAEPVTVEYRINRPDGQLRYLRGRNQPMTTVNGQTVIIGTTQDITDEVLLQQRLTDRIRFAEVLQEAMPDRIIVTDTANNIVSWNKSCENFYKLKKEEVVGRNFFDVRPETKLPAVLDRFNRSLQGETIHMPVVSTPNLPGFFELLMVPFRNETGSVIGILHVLHDITQQQHLQHQLHERLLFIEKLQEASVDRIVVLDNDLHIQLWNKQCELAYGFTQQQVLNKHVLEVFPKFKAGSLYQQCMRAIDGETMYVAADENKQPPDYYETYFIPMRGERGEMTGLLWIMHDLGERFLAQQTLRVSEQHLKDAQEIAHVGSWELNTLNNKLYWSDEIFRIYGYTPQSFEPDLQFYLSTTHTDDRTQLHHALDTAIKDGTPSDLTCRIYTIDGDIRYLQMRLQPLKDKSGNTTGIITATMQDISSQKLMEEELRNRSHFMRVKYQIDQQASAMKNIGSWQWKINTGKMIWGENVFNLLNYEEYTFEPDINRFISAVHAEDQVLAKQFLDNLVAGNLLQQTEIVLRVIVKDEIRYMRFSGRLMSHNTAIGAVMDNTDDTLLRQQLAERIASIEILNTELQEKNRRLEEINEELTTFAFVASHDLREPLRKIQIFSDWLGKQEAPNLSSEGLDKFNRIQAAVHRMDALIDDILNFSHVNTTNKNVPVKLNEVLDIVKNDLAEPVLATNAVIESDALPVVKGNPSQLSQLFQNLISNAIKYQAPGNIPHISITWRRVHGKEINPYLSAGDEEYIVISFADNGIGFEQQYSRKIFQMFQRLHGLNEYPGTGMGLAICKKIAEAYNGFLIAHGKPGKGAVFEWYLPADLEVHSK